MRRKVLILLATAFLLAACDPSGPVPVAPTPVGPVATSTPRAWGDLPTPPAEISKDKPDILVNLTHEQGATLFPARVIARDDSTAAGFQETIHYIGITFELKNNTTHDIDKVTGPLLLYDASGAELDADRVDGTTPIKAGATITQTAYFTDVASMESRQKLKVIPLEQMKAEFRPQFISYSNGTGQEIKYAK